MPPDLQWWVIPFWTFWGLIILVTIIQFVRHYRLGEEARRPPEKPSSRSPVAWLRYLLHWNLLQLDAARDPPEVSAQEWERFPKAAPKSSGVNVRNPPSKMTLSRSHRIHRGFHRVGVVLALIVMAFIGVIVFAEGIKIQVLHIQLGVIAGGAALVYALSRAIGWIIAGFAGD